MAIFKDNLKASATVKVLDRCIPQITINPDALIKMQLFVEGCTDEIGWLGTAYKNDKYNSIHIEDVFLFEQEVHSTTTEITPEGLSTFGETILQNPKGMEIWNNLKVWGHSHVNMSVFPSGQDDSQMETFSEGGHDWFIRIIANKKGDLRVDLYSYALGVIYNNLPWFATISEDEFAIEEQIIKLQALLEEFRNNRAKQFEEIVKKEIDEKVKKKNQITYYNQEYWKNKNNQNNKDTNTGKTTTTGKITIITPSTEVKEDEKKIKVTYDSNDILDDEDVYYWFTEYDLLDIGACETLQIVEELMYEYGYYNVFDKEELKVIWKTAKQVYHKFMGMDEEVTE